MLIPVVGELIASLGLILNTYYKHWPMEVAGITEALFPGLAGGWFTMLMVRLKISKTVQLLIINFFIQGSV